ncbi:UDP-N-acetylglucosamine 2-epimerase [Geoalkalibacter sp.]|uniref:UDP-N-acetylglucosamine 2-epimerase n=1 Tax=Geoalkalibacter sp. TaxID=3041440 RepID=UPI00272DD9A4|nr:UDP-N-acetylglucosamine 2-epimerase [Geoalkalibacter sp.]
MRRVCVFTGSRAEYGLLKPLLERFRDDPDIELQTLVSGMHLSPEFGLTYREIERDGFPLSETIDMLLSSDTPAGLGKSTGLGLIGFSDALARLKPDVLVILGDRFEALAAATAAVFHRIPVAHLHGGESTQGAMDEAFRHAITKMSHLHFASTEEYRRRIIQLGEHPSRVFNVGAIGLDVMEELDFLSKAELETDLGFELGDRNLLITFHPVTLENQSAEQQFRELLLAVDQLTSAKAIFTKANADTDGRVINQLIDRYVAENPERATAATSLGQLRYLSALRLVDAVVGNSSSGIIEAPSLGVPTVNIGDRQKGRTRAASVIDCAPVAADILAACRLAFTKELKKIARTAENPYRQKNTAGRIAKIIGSAEFADLKKAFFDLPQDCFRGL